MINNITCDTSILICGINITLRSSVEFNKYTYSAITSVINPKVINKILELLDFRYAIIETTARN
jgi:hypothetical protein